MAAVPQDPNWAPGTSQLRAGRGVADPTPPVPGAAPSVAGTYGGAASTPPKPSGVYDPMDPSQNAYINGADVAGRGVTPQFAGSISPAAARSQHGMFPADTPAATPPIAGSSPAAPDTRDNISQSNLATAKSLLPQGMRRFGDSQLPGIYSYRAKDGSLGFTDASGLNNPAVTNGVDPRGLRRGDTNVSSFANTGSTASGIDPSPLYGPNDTVQGSGYQPNNGLPQATGNNKAQGDNLFSLMSGQASDTSGNATGAMAPNANRALPVSSLRRLGVDTSPQALASMNTYQLGDMQKRLGGINTQGDPDQAAANHGLLARINARQQDLAQGALGKPGGFGQEGAGAAPTMMGPLGGAGGASGAGGMMKTMLGFSKAAEQQRHDAALEGTQGANAATTAKNSQQADLRDTESRMAALQSDPAGRAAYVLSQIPSTPAGLQSLKRSNPDKYGLLLQSINSDIGDAAGGSAASGASVSSLRFNHDLGPNNFHINEPNAVFGGRDARMPWYDAGGMVANGADRNRFSSPAYYQPQNVSKLRLLMQRENADEAPAPSGAGQ